MNKMLETIEKPAESPPIESIPDTKSAERMFEVDTQLEEAKKCLTSKEYKFILEYLKDHNQTRAAKEAGYSGNSAHVTGYRLLRKAHIVKVMSLEREKRGKLLEAESKLNSINRDNIILEVDSIAKRGKRDADRIAALALQAKILGLTKDIEVKSTAIFSFNNQSKTDTIVYSDVIDTTHCNTSTNKQNDS